LHFSRRVKKAMRINQVLAIVGAVALCLVTVHQSAKGQTAHALSPNEKQIAESFEQRAKAYAKMREQVEAQMPKLSKKPSLKKSKRTKSNFRNE
jgi:hypothetical protein